MKRSQLPLKKVKTRRTPKAYNNLEFLSSSDAGPIRVLSEYLEPKSRFDREKIQDTIVFFGSARVLPKSVAQLNLAKLQAKTLPHKKIPNVLKKRIEGAKIDLEMSGYYEDAAVLARMLTRWSSKLDHSSRFVICSGGGPGIMEAANKGALEGDGKSIGLNISLPMEQDSNPYISPNLSFEFHYFFMRKFWFMYLAKGLVMFPGGFGTMDELFEVLTLLQTKKVKKHIPIVLYGSRYWNEVLNFDAMIKHHTIYKRDLKLFRIADTPNEAFAYLKKELVRLYLSK